MDEPPVGPYRLEEKLRDGDPGALHRARHAETNAEVALLLIDASALPPKTRARLVREAKLLREVPHPGILPIVDAGDDGKNVFIATALVPGTTLRARLERGPLAVEDTLVLGSRVAAALAHAHELGLLHRGLTPENILLDEKGEPLLSELGLTPPLGPESALPETMRYLAPEQVAGASALVDARTDVWTLGAILHEALGGEPAFPGTGPDLARAIAAGEPAERAARSPREHDALAIILRCLEKDRAFRYQSAEDLAQDCRRALRAEPLAATRPGPFARRWSSLARRPGTLALVAAAASLVATVAIGLAVVLKQERDRALDDLIALEKTQAREDDERRVRAATDARVALGYQVKALAAEARSLTAAGAPPNEVRQTIQSIVALDSTEASLVLAGRLALTAGLVDDARVLLTRAARLTPGYDGLLALAEAQETWGEDPTRAYDELIARAIAKSEEEDPRILAASAARAGDARAALDLLGRALDRDGRSSGLHLRRALARERAGELDGALLDLEAATGLDPSRPDAFVDAARIHLRKGEAAEALTAAERAVALAPRGAGGWLARARARAVLGLVREARGDADRALAIKPDLAAAFAVRGAMRAQGADPVGALADLDRALELDPGLVEALVARARARLESSLESDLDAALGDATAAVKAAPRDPTAYEARAAVLMKRGRRPDAVADLKTAIALYGAHVPRSTRAAFEAASQP
jgi:tetratricopeptide (TPR) repeat protein